MRWTAMFAGTPKSKSALFSVISKAFGFSMKVARPVRVELTTYSFGGCRSIHLSYGRTVAFHRKALESHSRVIATCSIILALARLARQSVSGRGLDGFSGSRAGSLSSFRVQPFARALMS